jgi:hypothetical protein
MAQSAPVWAKIPTENPQPPRPAATGPASRTRPARTSSRPAALSGTGRAATRSSGRVVVELEWGVTVYPARREGDRWRAVWYEGGRRRQCEAVAEDKLAAKVTKVTEVAEVTEVTGRLAADAPGMERPGADLIAWYLSADRHPAGRPWSRRHADTQRRLCARFIAPVIAAVPCQDIRVADMQQIVNAAPTAGSWPPAYHAAGWRDPGGAGTWTWHSLRHVFCTARPVLLAPGAHRRVLHGRGRQHPRHPRHVRRRHGRHPGPRPHSHRIEGGQSLPDPAGNPAGQGRMDDGHRARPGHRRPHRPP